MPPYRFSPVVSRGACNKEGPATTNRIYIIMALILPRPRPELLPPSKLRKRYASLEALCRDLQGRALPAEIEAIINQAQAALNLLPETDASFPRRLVATRRSILKLLEKDLGWVPRNHYRGQWMALGMAAFGVPIGTALGVVTGNMGLLGIGLPMGMTLGMAVGANLDQKAERQGRQLACDTP